ncbi:MAG: dihydroorotate dehydrogenase [Chlamydiae bacterium]|nr:dihydroorotate dehydrogenase [Chlamydiota bacterium]
MMPWYPNHPAIYDINQSYAVNAEKGPFFSGEIPPRPNPSHPVDFLGFSLRSPLGVPAGPLLNSRWIHLASRLGFDLLVYKTIRSFAHPGHMLPNMIFVEPKEENLARALQEMPTDLSHLSVTNSFGMPSKSPDFLLQDIGKAKECLEEGQKLIVSVVGTPTQGMSFAEDFVRVAILAKEAGAEVIEANFSCPNVDKKEGCLYLSAETVKQFASRVVKAIAPTPLILKVGIFEQRSLLKDVLIAAARAGVRGVAGINSVSMQVQDTEGKPALGSHRLSSGICGACIRKQALHFIREASFINAEEKLHLTLLGCGGIMKQNHFDQFLEAGATVAMSATGMIWDPYLALRWHQEHA